MLEINAEYDNAIIELKKFIIEQLTSSKDCNIEYKLNLDYIHNHKNEKYRDFVVHKTGLEASELYKIATSFINNINGWIYRKLSTMSKEDRARILIDSRELENFINLVNDKIKEDSNGIFICRTKCT